MCSHFLFYSTPAESTELSKCFARQGIKIPIRKEKGYKRPTDSLYRAGGSSVSNSGRVSTAAEAMGRIGQGESKEDEEDNDE